MINVLLVDDHDLVRSGIKALLSSQNGIKVTAETNCGEEAIELARKKRPDVVLMDVNMPGIGGMEATRKISKLEQKTRVIILTMHSDEPLPSRLLKAGAAGYLTKGCSVEEMVTAIHEVHEGRNYVSARIAQSMVLSMLPGGESPLDALSQRELQVFFMLVRGERPQQISEKLYLSPKTISTYRTRIYSKLGVRSDAELARMAMRLGVLEELEP